MNGQTANDFVRALRFHLADPKPGHGIEPADMAHMDADALNQRHITAHRTGEYVGPEHDLPETLHHFLPKPDPDATRVMPTVARDAPASNDAPAAEAAEYRGGKPVNLAAVIERLSALDGELTEHYKRMRTLEQDLPALGRAVMRDMQRLWGRIERTETRMPAAPATLDTHALSQVRGLLSEALAGLGALSYRHTATAGWPERGTARAEGVVRTLHRMAAMLDGMATPEPERPLSLCPCRGLTNGPNGQRVIHEIGCSYFQGEV